MQGTIYHLRPLNSLLSMCLLGLLGLVAGRLEWPSSAGAEDSPTAQTHTAPALNETALNETALDETVLDETVLNETVLDETAFRGDRAFEYLQQICDLGPRISGSSGMKRQQAFLTRHFEALGGQVTRQPFRAAHPLRQAKVSMANLIVEWHPERKRRILLCAHYDTRPLPDRDRDPRKARSGVFLGANDGASGVALLMEMGHRIKTLESKYGVDFVFFDAEEFVFAERRDPYFLGSTWFARKHRSQPPEHTYRWGVLLDMVGDADLQIYQERNSVRWKDTRPLVLEIWATARRLGVQEFIGRPKHTVRDDHLKLRNIAKIPTCDIIDFDYAFWHTTHDTPDQCSARSLGKVGSVIEEWLRIVK